MIKPITNTDYQKRYKTTKYSGYTAVAGTAISTLTGIRKVKLPYKSGLHKAGAVIAIVSILVHIGTIRNWDNIFTKK